MFIDFWYGDSRKDVAYADRFFYPNAGIYRGNVYDRNGKPIGDYEEKDSVKIAEEFPGFFGD